MIVPDASVVSCTWTGPQRVWATLPVTVVRGAGRTAGEPPEPVPPEVVVVLVVARLAPTGSWAVAAGPEVEVW